MAKENNTTSTSFFFSNRSTTCETWTSLCLSIIHSKIICNFIYAPHILENINIYSPEQALKEPGTFYDRRINTVLMQGTLPWLRMYRCVEPLTVEWATKFTHVSWQPAGLVVQSSTRMTYHHARHGFKPRIDRVPPYVRLTILLWEQ